MILITIIIVIFISNLNAQLTTTATNLQQGELKGAYAGPYAYHAACMRSSAEEATACATSDLFRMEQRAAPIQLAEGAITDSEQSLQVTSGIV